MSRGAYKERALFRERNHQKIKPSDSLIGFMFCVLLSSQLLYPAVGICFESIFKTQMPGGSYTALMVLLFFVAFASFVHVYVLKNYSIDRRGIVVLLLSLAILVSCFLMDPQSIEAYDYPHYFALIAFPGLLLGLCMTRSKPFSLAILSRWFTFVMVILTIAAVAYEYEITKNGWVNRGSFDVTYQTVSYIAALAMGLNCALLVEQYGKRTKFSSKKNSLLLMLQVVMAPMQMACVLVSGGRGGVLLCAFYLVVMFGFFLSKAKSAGVRCLICLTVIAILLFSVAMLVKSDLLVSAGFSRVLDNPGNRDSLYSSTFELIGQRFLFGYGTGGYFCPAVPEYPHNIVLEVLLNWGLVGLVVFSIVIVMALVQLWRLWVRGEMPLTLVALFCYVVVIHMVSSSFFASSMFWFFVGLAFSPIACTRGVEER